jgi:L-ascorbate metabolism protein UlaG (beta-lactamase superfamily)
MKITKYHHSCLLIEEQGYRILMDPGNYSYESGLLDIKDLGSLDYVVITHEHQDHYHVPFLQEILQNFPQVKVVTNDSLAHSLQSINIPANEDIPNFIKTEVIPHERVFGMGEMAENIQIDLFDTLSHPGDSFSLNRTSRVLALPLQAPWGDVTEAIDLAERLQPETVLPIHDWHWKDEARKGFYAWIGKYLASKNIKFLNIESGEKVEV